MSSGQKQPEIIVIDDDDDEEEGEDEGKEMDAEDPSSKFPINDSGRGSNRPSKQNIRRSLFPDLESRSDCAKGSSQSTDAATFPSLSPEWHAIIYKFQKKQQQNSSTRDARDSTIQEWQIHRRPLVPDKSFFVDPDFLPVSSSLDGRQRMDDNLSSSKESLTVSRPNQSSLSATNTNVILCRCGFPAVAKRVQSDGPNYGRFYLACGGGTRAGRLQRAAVATTSVVSTTASSTVTDTGTKHASAKSKTIVNPYLRKNKSNVNAQKEESKSESPSSAFFQTCKFFQWDKDGSKGAAAMDAASKSTSASGYRARNVKHWQHFGLENQCCLYQKNTTMSSAQIRQGAVGNCWFLSALAVVAEQEYLIRRIVPHNSLNEIGCYQINLCLDGKWTPIIVDSYLPVLMEDNERTDGGVSKSKASPSTQNKRRRTSPVSPAKQQIKQSQRGGVLVEKTTSRSFLSYENRVVAYPAFAATPDRQLWPALVEKAYAKAHGSYSHLSGGWIAEGLTDLTGAPTETIVFSSLMNCNESMDDLWVRLLSFHQAGFVMGVATAQGGEGLVGGHAYSLLSALQVEDSVIGEQSKLTDYFGNQKTTPKETVRSTIRLVRIRNPWGRREWKGDWSAESDRWTRALRKRIQSTGDTYSKGDGTFFMSFEDMLQRFHHLDVAKTQQGWSFDSMDGVFEKGSDRVVSSKYVYRISPSRRMWAFLSLVQPKKRANTGERYWYCDPSILLLKSSDDGKSWTTAASTFSGVSRSCTVEVFLDPAYTYMLVPLSCISLTTAGFAFRVTCYSASSILMERISRDHWTTQVDVSQTVLVNLHKELLSREHKLLYYVAANCVLVCLHGDGCLYFVAINGMHDAFLSLHLNIDVDDGILPVFGLAKDTQDIPPRSQRVLVILSRTGKSTTTTQIKFRYMTSLVPTTRISNATPNLTRRLGSSIDISLAGDLLTSDTNTVSVQNKGGDTIDTYLWIPQIGEV